MTNEQTVKEYQETGNGELLGDLYKQNKGLLYKLAERYKAADNIEDLMQVAFIGMVTAAKNYDADKGTKFASYMQFWIKAELNRYTQGCRLVNIPAHATEAAYRIKGAEGRLTQIFKRKPTQNELSYATGIPADRIQEARHSLSLLDGRIGSLDAPMGADADICQYDFVPDDTDMECSVLDEMAAEETKAIWKIVDSLPKDEAEAVKLVYQAGHTQAEAAALLNIDYHSFRRRLKNGLFHMNYGKNKRKLLDLMDDAEAYSAGLHHTSLTAWRQTGFASQEWAVIRGLERAQSR